MKANEQPRPHILVVDDEEDLCELITLRLEHHGFRVSAEYASRGALEVLEREVVDAIILDLRLKNENGLDLLREIQKRSLDLPVVVLTAHGSIEVAVEAMRAGAYGFLTKPFDDHELIEKLGHAVERVRLRREVAGLRRLVGKREREEQLFGTSAAISNVRDIIARVAGSDATILLFGESGTGKEVAARSLHTLSARRDAPFVGINCGALPADLLGRERLRVRAFEDDDASVGPEGVRELTVADVDRGHRSGTAPEQAVGEAAGRCSEVEAAFPAGIDAEGVERARELDASSRDVRVIFTADRDGGVLGEERAGLVDAGLADVDLSREDQRLRPRA